MSKYEKYINLSRPESNYEKMDIIKRASQFMSFDALEGFKSNIEKKSIYIENKLLLSDEKISEINELLNKIALNNDLYVNISYFKQKLNKKEIINKVKIVKINTYKRYLELSNKSKINFEDIIDINIIDF